MAYFQAKNPNFDKFWVLLQWKLLVFYPHLVNFTAVWPILWPFGILYGYLVYFSRVVPRKIWQPWTNSCCWNLASEVIRTMYVPGMSGPALRKRRLPDLRTSPSSRKARTRPETAEGLPDFY
jgi:hypothetical protein